MGTGLLTASRSLSRLDRRWITVALWLGMGLGLALCYIGEMRLVMLAALLLFGGLAAVRPDLALLFVPLTTPLFLTPIVLPTTGRQLALPPHELALLVTAATTLPTMLVQRYRSRVLIATIDDSRRTAKLSSIVRRLSSRALGTSPSRSRWLYCVARRYAPEALLLVSGVAGVLMAVPEPEALHDALRAFRWFIAEPLLFVAMVHSHRFWRQAAPRVDPATHARRMINAFVIGGAAVALVGIIQFMFYLLHAHSEPASFAASAGALGGMRRITSVYGNPNNLALYLGRVWPLAAALAIVDQGRRTNDQRRQMLVFGFSAVVCLIGLLLSLSRGAWLGASVALIILIIPAARRRFGRRLLPGILTAGSVLAAAILVIFALRGGLLGGSSNVRILFWQESLKLLDQHPWGVGLDQFFYYHHPAYGRSQIDPALANTQERYARQPHNLIFELWLNLGPLGVLAFGWLLARWLGHALATLRAPADAGTAAIARGAIAAVAAALVHGLVDSFYFWPAIAIAFWLLLGVCALLDSQSR
ncbi:MAG TPA: O-antigen ligase family protein [Roseiflexaceae bacterium]|nr:O-antigen ligase family protein [Roseiflexaceae bacterium]